MTAKHTPGPWAGSGVRWGKEIPLRAVDQEGLCFSLTFISSDDAARVAEAKANAHLIGAAPDLLAALRELAGAGAEEWGTSRPCVSNALEAIAKATGAQA